MATAACGASAACQQDQQCCALSSGGVTWCCDKVTQRCGTQTRNTCFSATPPPSPPPPSSGSGSGASTTTIVIVSVVVGVVVLGLFILVLLLSRRRRAEKQAAREREVAELRSKYTFRNGELVLKSRVVPPPTAAPPSQEGSFASVMRHSHHEDDRDFTTVDDSDTEMTPIANEFRQSSAAAKKPPAASAPPITTDDVGRIGDLVPRYANAPIPLKSVTLVSDALVSVRDEDAETISLINFRTGEVVERQTPPGSEAAIVNPASQAIVAVKYDTTVRTMRWSSDSGAHPSVVSEATVTSPVRFWRWLDETHIMMVTPRDLVLWPTGQAPPWTIAPRELETNVQITYCTSDESRLHYMVNGIVKVADGSIVGRTQLVSRSRNGGTVTTNQVLDGHTGCFVTTLQSNASVPTTLACLAWSKNRRCKVMVMEVCSEPNASPRFARKQSDIQLKFAQEFPVGVLLNASSLTVLIVTCRGQAYCVDVNSGATLVTTQVCDNLVYYGISLGGTNSALCCVSSRGALFRVVPPAEKHDSDTVWIADVEYALDVDEARGLECPICVSLMSDVAMVARCGHNFCMKCITKVRDAKSPAQCPVCRCAIDTIVADAKMERRVGALKFRCARNRACMWVGKASEQMTHVCRGASLASVPVPTVDISQPSLPLPPQLS